MANNQTLTYFSTGQIPNNIQITSKGFHQRQASPGESAKIYERNFTNSNQPEVKQPLKTEHKTHTYKQNFDIRNKISELYPQQKNLPNSSKMLRTQYNQASDSVIDHYNPIHYHNYQIYKSRDHTKQSQTPQTNNQGYIVNKHEFEGQKGSNEFQNQKKNEILSNNLPRTNLYVTKEYVRLNKDFQEKALVNNVQCESIDAPDWCQSSLQHYTVENFDVLRKNKPNKKNIPKTDLLGNTLTDQIIQPETFNIIPPHKGLRYEKSKMAMTEKYYDELKKQLPLAQRLSRSSLKFDWKEDVSKQSYDKFEIKSKINQDVLPFIKRIEEKRNNIDKPLKIGRENPSLLKQEKQLLLKIGHPDSTYTFIKS